MLAILSYSPFPPNLKLQQYKVVLQWYHHKLTHSFSSVLYVHAYFFFLNTNLSLWNFRVCTISGLFCRKFHKCILSSEQTETRAPYKTQEIKLSIIPMRLNQLAYNSYKMFPLFIVHKCLSFVSYQNESVNILYHFWHENSKKKKEWIINTIFCYPCNWIYTV